MSVKSSITNNVCTLTLCNSSRANSLTSDMCSQLVVALDEVERNPVVRVVVLTGDGMDLSSASSAAATPPFDAALAVFDRVAKFPKPTIAKMNGPALGGGVGLLFCTDIRIALDSAFIQLAEVKRGLIPAIISLYIVPQLGPSLSRQYFLTGERVSANTLVNCGGHIAACVSSTENLEAKVNEFAQILVQGAPNAQATIKHMVQFISDSSNSEPEKFAHIKKVFNDMLVSKEATYGMYKLHFAIKKCILHVI
ncbi:EnoyL-CoA hydratase [Physocladia obscura]|uniref:EnoyL-CoA hydratase n=1 Tax=Physocladia obscura TaxID=109957 RepID=A0AAD5T737_9FUNG|nr:EnoyL-CoA hydratase [Physocladia obscura]